MQVIKTIKLDDQEQQLLNNRVLPNVGVGLEGEERTKVIGKIRHLATGNSAPLEYINECEANIKRAIELGAQLAEDFAARSSQQVDELLDGLELIQTVKLVLDG